MSVKIIIRELLQSIYRKPIQILPIMFRYNFILCLCFNLFITLYLFNNTPINQM